MGRKLQIGHIFGGGGAVGPLPVAATQYFRHQGGKFIYLDSNGRITLALSATEYLFGWALAPRAGVGAGSAGSAYWLSGSAGVDKLLVINDLDAVFCIGGGTFVDARVGECADLVSVNDGTAQYANLGTNAQDVLLVQGTFAAGDTSYAFVKLNPNEIQRDT